MQGKRKKGERVKEDKGNAVSTKRCKK